MQDGKNRCEDFGFNYAFSALAACREKIFARKFKRSSAADFWRRRRITVHTVKEPLGFGKRVTVLQVGATIDRDFKNAARSREEDET